ncbi:MAG: hypothetical protein K0V04_26440 [Deltaproteobacteria bacterium]|nr:hypothetical protein [Deltaproteobacteria bacterium]
MKTITTSIASIVLATAAALTATPASAADSKIYAGEMCSPNKDDSTVSHFWGRLKNASATTTNFECPVVRDQTGTKINHGDAWVINQNYNQSLSCTLGLLLPLSGGVSGASGFFSTRSTAVVSSAPQKLASFGSLGHLLNGYAAMICSIPGVYNGQQSGLVSYHVNEA